MSASSSSADPTAPAPVVVHFLSDSRAESILWLLEELAVDYRIHYWRREPNMLAPKGLRQIHPLGKSPVIEHGNKVVAETGNLIAYLLHRAFPSETTAAFTQFPTEDARETDSYFLFYVEGSLMPILVNKLVFSKFPAMSPWYIRPIISSFASSVDKMWLDRQLVTHLAMIDDVLQKSPTGWIAGGAEPTGADFALFFPLNKLSTGRGGDVPCPDSIKAWVDRVKARPAFKAAFAKLAEAEKAYDAGLHALEGEGASTTTATVSKL